LAVRELVVKELTRGWKIGDTFHAVAKYLHKYLRLLGR
jgi:hypothetical protein